MSLPPQSQVPVAVGTRLDGCASIAQTGVDLRAVLQYRVKVLQQPLSEPTDYVVPANVCHLLIVLLFQFVNVPLVPAPVRVVTAQSTYRATYLRVPLGGQANLRETYLVMLPYGKQETVPRFLFPKFLRGPIFDVFLATPVRFLPHRQSR